MNYNFIHVSSFVDDNVVVGQGTEIRKFLSHAGRCPYWGQLCL